MEDENFDIYGDLDEALIEPLQEVTVKKNAIEKAKEEEFIKNKEESEKVLLKLELENQKIKENIAILLNTAKSEIDR